MTRSHAPIFWLLFGAGGMLAALFGPALVVVTGWMDLPSYASVHAVVHSIIGKLFLFFAVALFAWHAAHRILCSLHDVGIHKGLGAKLCCYGVAGAISVAAAVALAGI
ncbi:MAG TPA: fumarate reductase subunit FrdD [Ramlibacter sp.]|jgi:fumarate reductase subunit D